MQPELFNQATSAGLGGKLLALLIVLLIWSVIWKGIALWKAARNGAKAWYIIMLVLNTAGILEIIYIFAVAKKTEVAKTSTTSIPTPQA